MRKRLLIPVLIGSMSLLMSITSFSAIKVTGTAVIDGATKPVNTDWFYTSTLPSNTKDFITATLTWTWTDGDTTTVNYVYKTIKDTYPLWKIGEGGYYYYKTSATQALKSTTTPDGYRVDAQGRWIDNSGNAVTANIGNNILNTKEKYSEKNDSDIITIQKEYLRSLFQESCTGYDDIRTYDEETSSISSATNLQFGDWLITWNADYGMNNGIDFCRVSMPAWTETSRVNEQVLRLMFGDELGSDIFQYLQTIGSNYRDDCAGCADRDLVNKFDLNKFKGRATDYGKSIWNVKTEYDGSIIFTLN